MYPTLFHIRQREREHPLMAFAPNAIFVSEAVARNGRMRSCMVTAVSELTHDETVEREAEKTPQMQRPGRPG